MMVDFEFRIQLRLETAGCILELCFDPRHVRKNCGQPLWPQHDQRDRGDEQQVDRVIDAHEPPGYLAGAYLRSPPERL